MPASKAEQVLDALQAVLKSSGGNDRAQQRAAEKIPDGGLIILRDGDPGEPEQALGGFRNAYYQHAVEIEVYVEEGDAATPQQRSRAPPADRCCARGGPDARRPRFRPDVLAGPNPASRRSPGAPVIKGATLLVTVSSATDAPLTPDIPSSESEGHARANSMRIRASRLSAEQATMAVIYKPASRLQAARWLYRDRDRPRAAYWSATSRPA